MFIIDLENMSENSCQSSDKKPDIYDSKDIILLTEMNLKILKKYTNDKYYKEYRLKTWLNNIEL